MTSLLRAPKFSVVDDSGNPASGWKVYFYEDGTSTPKDTYADRDKNATNANPVVLDSRGEATIYGEGSYKIVVKDANDATKYTVDNYEWPIDIDSSGDVTFQNNVTISGSSTFTGVITPNGGTDGYLLSEIKALTAPSTDGVYVYANGRSSVGDGYEGWFYWDSSDLSTEVTNDTQNGIYIPPNSDSTGASGAWVRQYSGGILVDWFGAVGDLTTDDSTAINTAQTVKDALVSTSATQGGVAAGNIPALLFNSRKPGYLVSSAIDISSNYLVIDTNDGGRARIEAGGGTHFIFDTGVSADSVTQGYTTPANAAPTSGTDFNGGGWRFVCRNIIFDDYQNAVHVDNGNVNTGHVEFDNCEFHGSVADTSYFALWLTVKSTHTHIHDCFFDHGQFLHAEKCDVVHFENNWLTLPPLDSNDDHVIYANIGHFYFDRNIITPDGGSGDETAIIKMVAGEAFIASQNRTGAEGNGMPTFLNWRVAADGTKKNLISFTDTRVFSQVASSGTDSVKALVRLWRAPNRIVMRGLYGDMNEDSPSPDERYLHFASGQQSTVLSDMDGELGTKFDFDNTVAMWLLPTEIKYKLFRGQQTQVVLRGTEESSNDGSGTSYFDTGVTPAQLNGYAMIWKYQLIANDASGSNTKYRNVHTGEIIAYTGNDTGVKTAITAAQINNPTAIIADGGDPITFDAVWWNGSTESSNVAADDTNNEIRLKVGGQTAGSEGADLLLVLERTIPSYPNSFI